ncbi:MAG: hypothetical protein ABI684_13995, partial [Nitrospirota bacterium]
MDAVSCFLKKSSNIEDVCWFTDAPFFCRRDAALGVLTFPQKTTPLARKEEHTIAVCRLVVAAYRRIGGCSRSLRQQC